MDFLRKKYISSLLITLTIFILVFVFVGRLNRDRIQHLNSLQQQISIDLMAVETQFDLLKTAPCSSMTQSLLSRELGELGTKLDFALEKQGNANPEVINLKKHYSLLQVKDYLLMQELAGKCDVQVDALLYFYTNDCADCRRQGYVLTAFKTDYPDIRIYSFDMDLDFPVIGTFASLYDLNGIYPILIADGTRYEGFQSRENLEEIFAEYIHELEIQQRIEAGKQYLIDHESMDDITLEDIIMTKHQSDTQFVYTILGDVLVVLKYDEETQSFEIQEN